GRGHGGAYRPEDAEPRRRGALERDRGRGLPHAAGVDQRGAAGAGQEVTGFPSEESAMGETRPEPLAADEAPARALERLWERGERPDVHAFLAPLAGRPAAQLAAALAVDQWRRWRAGERVP